MEGKRKSKIRFCVKKVCKGHSNRPMINNGREYNESLNLGVSDTILSEQNGKTIKYKYYDKRA